jgi:site-specific recombinase XerD
MSDSELVIVSVDTFATPAIIARAGPTTRKKFFEFFTVPVRHANTQTAYYRAIQQFQAWAKRDGNQDLEDIEPITVAAYIETLQRESPYSHEEMVAHFF